MPIALTDKNSTVWLCLPVSTMGTRPRVCLFYLLLENVSYSVFHCLYYFEPFCKKNTHCEINEPFLKNNNTLLWRSEANFWEQVDSCTCTTKTWWIERDATTGWERAAFVVIGRTNSQIQLLIFSKEMINDVYSRRDFLFHKRGWLSLTYFLSDDL